MIRRTVRILAVLGGLTLAPMVLSQQVSANDFYSPDKDSGAYSPSIVTTTTTTHSYDFPDSAPAVTTSDNIINDCLVSVGGESRGTGGNGGEQSGRGYDVDNDGRGDFETSREAREAGYDNASRVDNCGNCGNMDRR